MLSKSRGNAGEGPPEFKSEVQHSVFRSDLLRLCIAQMNSTRCRLLDAHLGV